MSNQNDVTIEEWTKIVSEEEWYRDFNCNGSATFWAGQGRARSADESPTEPPEQLPKLLPEGVFSPLVPLIKGLPAGCGNKTAWRKPQPASRTPARV